MNKTTIRTIQKYKQENKKITALTAYDYSTAKILDEAGLDMILVGDSLAMVALGYETTHAITVDDMLYHTKAVARGVNDSLVVADMPFMSYQHDVKEALENAGKFIKAGAQAVKIESSNEHILKVIKRCVESGIPVLGHLGFTPQLLHTMGGYKIQGKESKLFERIYDQAKALEAAGVFAIVLEMMPEETAKVLTESISIPTISIGAGRYCSGQILVTDDLIGKYENFTPKFARKYADIASIVKEAAINYKNDVISGAFPAENEVFKLSEEEKQQIELKKKFNEWHVQ